MLAWVGVRAVLALHPVFGKDRLDLVPEVLVDDRRMTTGMNLSLVSDLAAIKPVAQHVVERAAIERTAAGHLARRRDEAFGDDARLRQIIAQIQNRLEFDVAAEDVADRLGLAFNDHQFPVADLVAQRGPPAHPHSLGLRRGDLVPNAFPRDLAFELSEGQQHVEGESPHRGGGVERLGDGDERDVRGVEDFDDLGEVGQRAGEPVDLVDDDGADETGGDVGEQTLEGRSLQGAAGEAAVVVHHRRGDPALGSLAGDIGLAGLPLGVEGVEVLLQSLLRGLTGVDHATDRLLGGDGG